MPIKDDFKKHYIAVIGGSISGSEAANILAKNGFRVVVFDMNKSGNLKRLISGEDVGTLVNQ